MLTKENLDKVISLNCKDEGNILILNKILSKNIKPLKKYKDKEIPLIDVEKVVTLLLKKYNISIQSIYFSGDWYSASILNLDNHEWLRNVYAITLYELWLKIAIKLYAEIKLNDISIKGEKENEK